MYTLTGEQKQQCTRHQYKGDNNSIHENLMKPVWDVIESRIPAYICPTAITTTGLVANLVPCVVLMFAAPTATEDLSSWLLLVCVFGMVMHQNLDNMDGRHARRLGVETAIADFFDHGVDGIATGITLINIAIALKLGTHVGWLVVIVTLYMALFYSFHWQEYVTSVAYYAMIDVTEALDMGIGLVFISAVLGQDIWNGSIRLVGFVMDKRLAILMIMALAGVFRIIKTSIKIYSHGKVKEKIQHAMYPCITVVYHMVVLGLSMFINNDVYTQLPVVMSLIIIITFCRAAYEVMIAFYTQSVSGVITINKIMTLIFFVGAVTRMINTRVFLFAFLVLSAVDLLLYFYCMVCDMNDAFGFKWFRPTLDKHSTSNGKCQ